VSGIMEYARQAALGIGIRGASHKQSLQLSHLEYACQAAELAAHLTSSAKCGEIYNMLAVECVEI
jgi:hypothetical protein